MQNSTYVISHGAITEGSGYIVLTDFLHWTKHEEELRDWCTNNLSKGASAFEGAIIEYTSEEELVMFILRWS
jgi:hypothetical protein